MRTWWAIAMFAVACVGGAAHAATNVAVVNVAKASEKYLKTADLESQFDVNRRKVGQERDAMKQKAEGANKSLQEELKPGTEEYRQRKKEIAVMDAELQWFTDSEGQKIEQGLAMSLRSIFDDIRAVTKEVAEEKGFDVVLASDQLPAETPDSPGQVRQHILLQKVLYWNDKTDITDEVINRLNAKYKAGSAAAPPTAAPAPDAAKPGADSGKSKPKDAPTRPVEAKKKP